MKHVRKSISAGRARPPVSACLLLTLLLALANASAVEVQIQSEYGPERVSPSVIQSGTFTAGEQIIFQAPKFVYLDRYKNELDPTPENIQNLAFYRARSLGATIDGGNVQLSGNNTFIETLNADINVVWLWELDYAVIVESATEGIDGLEPTLGNPAINGTPTPVGKNWFPADTLISTSMDGVVTEGNVVDTRFSTRGYTVENAPDQDDHYLLFDGDSSLVNVSSVNFAPFGDFTLDYWARREPGVVSREQEIVRFNNDPELSVTGLELLRAGFRPSTDPDNPNGMFLATSDSGGVIAEVPGAFVDGIWHHWAWIFQSASKALLCYRDGVVVATFNDVEVDSLVPGIRSTLHNGTPGQSFPAFPASAFLSGSHTFEAEDFSASTQWTLVTDETASGGVFVQSEFRPDSGYLEYNQSDSGVNVPAGTHRIVMRIVGISETSLGISINGNSVGDIVIPQVVDGDEWANVASDPFTVTEPITTVRFTYTGPHHPVASFDQFQIQTQTGLDSVAGGLGFPVAGVGVISEFGLGQATQSEYFAFDFVTTLQIDEAGSYGFKLSSDDGSILYLDGQELVNNDGVHDVKSVSGTTNLTAGAHQLRVGYFQVDSASALSVEWDPPTDDPDLGFVPIPDNLLVTGNAIRSMQIGNRLDQDRPFGGGLNNLRFWRRALTVDEVLSSRRTAEFGPGENGLSVEFTFDNFLAAGDTIVSTEGDRYLGVLRDFGPDGTRQVATFPNPTSVFDVPTSNTIDLGISVTPAYTLEALVSFPLPTTASGSRILFSAEWHNDGSDGYVLIDAVGRLGMTSRKGALFYDSGYNVGGLTGWHRVSAVADLTSTTFYIDGIEVGSSSFRINTKLQWIGNSGNQNSDLEAPIGLIDDVRVWFLARTQVELNSDSFATLAGDETGLEAYWTFDDLSTTDVTGNGHDLGLSDGAATTTLVAPPTLSNAINFPEFIFQESDIVDRVGTDSFALQDWLRVTWLWNEEFRLKLDVNSPRFAIMPFITAVAPGNEEFEGSTTREIWLPRFSEVTVGTYYRTLDGCFTLTGINGATKLYNGLTVEGMMDGTRNGRATRQVTFPILSEPGTMQFTFSDTVYHAVLPLGEGLDATTTDAVNAQVVPELCLAAELKPSADAVQVIARNASRLGGAGDPDAYDEINNILYTLWPGEFTYSWADAESNQPARTLLVASGFPGDTIDTSWQIEDKQGYRLDSDGARIMDSGNDPTTLATLPVVDDGFPGSPGSHYDYLYTVDTNKAIPVNLDEDDSDQWFWISQAFADNSVASDTTHEFFSNAAGQSVLLYSHRPNPGEVATGDLSRETLAVRVVNSIPLDEHTEEGDGLSYGTHRELHVTRSTGIYAASSQGAGPAFGFGNNVTRSMDFWLKLDTDPSSPDSDRIVFEIDVADQSNVVQFGVRASSHSTNPGGYFYSVGNYTTQDVALEIEFTGVSADGQWHHWAIATDTGDQRFFLDGNLIHSAGEPYPFPESQENTQFYGYSKVEGGLWLEGSLDNWRVWPQSMTTAEVRQAMTSFDPTDSTLWFAVSFDTAIDPALPQIIHKDIGNAGGDVRVFNSDGSDGEALAVLELQAADGPAEVASRLDSKLDTAALGAGFVLNDISNYNPTLYDRGAPVGQWGEVFPVNWHRLFETDNRKLLIAYYENPYLGMDPGSSALHPNVAWPYIAIDYNDVDYPAVGKDKDNRIHIASRLGSEGVDAESLDQFVIDPTIYTGFAIYNQPDESEVAGYNPNEEHALVAPSIKAQLTGDGLFKLDQNAAFALQNRLNRDNRYTDSPTDAELDPSYTSDPWVLVQYQEIVSGQWHMAAYKVEANRTGGGDRANDLFPQLDPVTHLPTDENGQPVSQPSDPMYDFDYPEYAGDVFIPPYPVNLAVGNLNMANDLGGNVEIGGVQQRALWNDKDGIAWVVSGEGRFFYENWYPLQDVFWFDFDRDGSNDMPAGTEIAWMPSSGTNGEAATFLSPTQPLRTRYSTYWRDNYPVLKRGESGTYPGGENLADHPLDEGLPALVNMASTEIVFDSRTPAMVFEEGDEDAPGGIKDYSARITRPLDRYESETIGFDSLATGTLTPENIDHVQVVGARWYFKDLTGSLQKRFYYDALLSKLVFRGRLNDLEGGSPKISVTPVSLYVLEPNVLTADDYETLKELPVTAGGTVDAEWDEAIEAIYEQSQNPSEVEGITPVTTSNTPPLYWAGVQDPFAEAVEQFPFYTESISNGVPGSSFTSDASIGETDYQNLSSLGTGSALVPNPSLLSEATDEDLYVTVVENNHPDVNGAITLHIIQVGDARFRGGIKVVEAQDVFDEKINLRHTADFGGNTEEAYYEWWVHDIAALQTLGTPDGTGSDGWQLIDMGLGMNQIEFTGRPDLMISDKLFFVRYGEQEELLNATDANGNALGNDPENGSIDPDSWRKVAFQQDSYVITDPDERVPYQWAGAANSPQLQADGSKLEIPQLVMGWVKRVLDRINPYEARYSDFLNSESPATYSSMLVEAGAPFNGAVALNSDKDVIENVGLIQLYETVLLRAKELTLDVNGAANSGTNQALLLAATRLAFLYDLLAREAYSDAQNPTILVTPENGLATAAPFVHAFYNQEASLLYEELALLRGTDFIKAYPSYNRLFWNYVKGIGEAAYNANYRIYDTNEDGFINETDAATLFPQGHGDAWGHFLSAGKMHYNLLRDGNQAFVWEAKSELYGLLDNVIEVDYLDEKSFARVAAAKARAGGEIVAATYREAYTQDPDGQWQGYEDPDQARAWGVTEWASRSGQAALFDWAIANAIVPEEAAAGSEDLDRIDRIANQAEIAEVAASYVGIQHTIDLSNNGGNPLGLDNDALSFDIDPFYDGIDWERATHFEQVYDRALAAAANALAALEFASRADQQLQGTADDTLSLQTDALRQDIDYRNRLIEIFGTPFEGTIGPGQFYAEGYYGPDTTFYQYIAHTEVEDFVPGSDPRFLNLNLENTANSYSALNFHLTSSSIRAGKVEDLFNDYYLSRDFGSVGVEGSGANNILTVEVPVIDTGNYAFQAPQEWGSRASYGRIQGLLNELVTAQLELDIAVEDYADYIEDLLLTNQRLETELDLQRMKSKDRIVYQTFLNVTSTVEKVLEPFIAHYKGKGEEAWRLALAEKESYPLVNGFSDDVTSIARSIFLFTGNGLLLGFDETSKIFEIANSLREVVEELTEHLHELDEATFEAFGELLESVEHMADKLKEEERQRLSIASALKKIGSVVRDIRTAEAEGQRLLQERAAFNAVLAAKAQRNRYSDLLLRLTRNDSLQKYQSAFDNALRYAWLAAKAYDYETSLSPNSAGSANTLLEKIVRTRQLGNFVRPLESGNWSAVQPRIGNGGLAEILAQLKGSFDALKGQLGINNPRNEVGTLSLRYEHFRIPLTSSGTSYNNWVSALKDSKVDDLWQVAEFRQYCRPFADPADGAQPGLVIEFSTEITSGLNVFGNPLGAGDHAYSVANFATKIRSVGVQFQNYNNVSGVSLTPRVYLIPVGIDRIRMSDSQNPAIRDWNVAEQRIPMPFQINQTQLEDPNFIPSIDTLGGTFGELSRIGDFRAYDASSADPYTTDSRLVGRSVWNTRWLLIIPGASLHADPATGLTNFIGGNETGDTDGVQDILLQFKTYSHEGF